MYLWIPAVYRSFLRGRFLGCKSCTILLNAAVRRERSLAKIEIDSRLCRRIKCLIGRFQGRSESRDIAVRIQTDPKIRSLSKETRLFCIKFFRTSYDRVPLVISRPFYVRLYPALWFAVQERFRERLLHQAIIKSRFVDIDSAVKNSSRYQGWCMKRIRACRRRRPARRHAMDEQDWNRDYRSAR